jgi:hypothetical protein
MNSRL